MNAPERIWAWDYDDCSSDNEDDWELSITIWDTKDPYPLQSVEYIRADLHAAVIAERDALRAGIEKLANRMSAGTTATRAHADALMMMLQETTK